MTTFIKMVMVQHCLILIKRIWPPAFEQVHEHKCYLYSVTLYNYYIGTLLSTV